MYDVTAMTSIQSAPIRRGPKARPFPSPITQYRISPEQPSGATARPSDLPIAVRIEITLEDPDADPWESEEEQPFRYQRTVQLQVPPLDAAHLFLTRNANPEDHESELCLERGGQYAWLVRAVM